MTLGTRLLRLWRAEWNAFFDRLENRPHRREAVAHAGPQGLRTSGRHAEALTGRTKIPDPAWIPKGDMAAIWLRVVVTAALGALLALAVLISETFAAGWSGAVMVALTGVETGLICRWGRRPAWPWLAWGGLLAWNALASFGGVAGGAVWLVFRAGLRSGYAFPSRPLAAVGREILVTGGGLLPLVLVDGTPAAWALWVGIFFLIQALYYVLFVPPAPEEAFERARRRVERLLAGLEGLGVGPGPGQDPNASDPQPGGRAAATAASRRAAIQRASSSAS